MSLAILVSSCSSGQASRGELPDASADGAGASRGYALRDTLGARGAADLAHFGCLAWDGITWDPAHAGPSLTLSNGNLSAQDLTWWTRSSTRSTQWVSSGKWYWEIRIDDAQPAGAQPLSYPDIGVGTAAAPLTFPDYIGGDWNGWGFSPTDSYTYDDATLGHYGLWSAAAAAGGAVVGDVIGVELDADEGTLAFTKNGTSLGTAFTDLPKGKPLYAMVGDFDSYFAASARFAPPFAETVPDGFAPLDCAPCGGPGQSCCTGAVCDVGSTCVASTFACVPTCPDGQVWDPPSYACVTACDPGFTWDPANTGSPVTLSNGNLSAQEMQWWTRASTRATRFVTSGRWYWEISIDDATPMPQAASSYPDLGVGTPGAPLAGTYIGGDWRSWGLSPTDLTLFDDAEAGDWGPWTAASAVGPAAVGDVIGVALDADHGTLAFYRNGEAYGTAFSALPSGKPLYPMLGATDSYFAASARFAPPFAAPTPAGFTPIACAPCGAADQACCTGGTCNAGSSCDTATHTCIPDCPAGMIWNPPSDACVPACATGVTWDPASTGTTIVLSNGNLSAQMAPGSPTDATTRATRSVTSGKWYWEIEIDDALPVNANPLSLLDVGVGTAAESPNKYLGVDANGWGYLPAASYYVEAGSVGSWPQSAAVGGAGVGDVLGVVLDADDGTLGFYKNGVFIGTEFTSLPRGTPLYAMVGDWGYFAATARFAPPFQYAVPAGYTPYACTAAWPAPDGGVEGGALDAGTAGDAADGGTGDATTGGGGGACGFDAGPPRATPVCGDGWRDPATEECDDGLGSSAARRGCSAQCQVLDELAVAPVVPESGPVTAARTLGEGRHPLAVSDATFAVAFQETDATPPVLSLATFNAQAVATGNVLPFSGGSNVVQNSNPVVAALPCNKYVAAWAAFDADGGDELDVALRLVDASASTTGPLLQANTTTAFSQFDPDVVWTGSQLVVAWVDDSDAATQPDIRFRTFDDNLQPTSGEQTLAGTAGSEADVALAVGGGGAWAAAWRDDQGGMETVQASAGGVSWSVVPAFLPAPAPSKPALAALDATHWLLAYAVGVARGDAGVVNGSKIQVAILDAAAPGAVSGSDVPGLDPSVVGLDQDQPSAVTVDGRVLLAWWTAAAQGDPKGEELWFKPLGWNAGNLDLTATEVQLPRWPQARIGDQRRPALAASTLPPGGALAVAWDDLGGGVAAGEGQGDVVVELVPTPPLRTAGDGGP